MRTFIAIELGDAIRERLAHAQERLRACRCGVKWVRPEQIHLTVKFLGEIDEGAAADVAAAMAAAAEGVGGLDLRVAGLGAFPPRGAPRVVWAGIEEPSGRLATLHKRLDLELEKLGIERETRPFHPHATLGRVKDRRAGRPLRALIDTQRTAEFGARTVDDMVLLRSVLSPTGPTYTPLHRQPL